jgi:transcriptional regulator with XRE-family HTH domain
MTTRLQLEADRRAAALRRSLADDIGRLREDAGLTRVALGTAAGVDPSLITKVERLAVLPTVETYARICAALGADLHARIYPNTGPPIHDRHQAPIAELVLELAHPDRWRASAEVGVRRPSRGWVDLVLHDRRARTLVASELESDISRVEQLVRWSTAKAESLPSASEWPG